MGFASFVWNREYATSAMLMYSPATTGRFYVLAGKSLEGPFHRDFHFMDLDHIGEWHQLFAYPHSELDIEEISGWQMGVHEDEAYMFTGTKRMDCFDLATETWGEIRTRCEGSWTWELSDLQDYGMQVLNGRMYVFGGTHPECMLGCNLWMVLDIATRTWRKLSGDARTRKADNNVPGPRRLPVMWTDMRDGVQKIWLMYGEADRMSAGMLGEPHSAMYGYGCNDLWSWNVQKEVWQRERIMGNPPCPRSEMGYTFVSVNRQ